jgi:hypothetical protein
MSLRPDIDFVNFSLQEINKIADYQDYALRLSAFHGAQRKKVD